MVKVKYLGIAGFAIAAALTIGLSAPTYASSYKDGVLTASSDSAVSLQQVASGDPFKSCMLDKASFKGLIGDLVNDRTSITIRGSINDIRCALVQIYDAIEGNVYDNYTGVVTDDDSTAALKTQLAKIRRLTLSIQGDAEITADDIAYIKYITTFTEMNLKPRSSIEINVNGNVTFARRSLLTTTSTDDYGNFIHITDLFDGQFYLNQVTGTITLPHSIDRKNPMLFFGDANWSTAFYEKVVLKDSSETLLTQINRENADYFYSELNAAGNVEVSVTGVANRTEVNVYAYSTPVRVTCTGRNGACVVRNHSLEVILPTGLSAGQHILAFYDQVTGKLLGYTEITVAGNINANVPGKGDTLAPGTGVVKTGAAKVTTPVAAAPAAKTSPAPVAETVANTETPASAEEVNLALAGFIATIGTAASAVIISKKNA